MPEEPILWDWDYTEEDGWRPEEFTPEEGFDYGLFNDATGEVDAITLPGQDPPVPAPPPPVPPPPAPDPPRPKPVKKPKPIVPGNWD